MNKATRETIIAKLGDASGKLLELADQAEKLAPIVAPNTSEIDIFFDIIGKMNDYLVEYGFRLMIMIIIQKNGCALRIAIHDTAPTQIKQ